MDGRRDAFDGVERGMSFGTRRHGPRRSRLHKSGTCDVHRILSRFL